MPDCQASQFCQSWSGSSLPVTSCSSSQCGSQACAASFEGHIPDTIFPRWQVRTIERVCEIPHEGPFCDLMWSDPEDIDTWAVSPRGAGWLFGARVTAEFNRINGLDLVCRAHQLVQEGLKFMFTGALAAAEGNGLEMVGVLRARGEP